MAGKLPDAAHELYAHVRMLEHTLGTLLAMQLAKAPDLLSARFKEELMLSRPRERAEQTAPIAERIGELLEVFLEKVSRIEDSYRDSAASQPQSGSPGSTQ
jgi:hypothetical protein